MPTEKFEDLSLSRELRKAVKDLRFEAMTPIQAKAIPLILQGKDLRQGGIPPKGSTGT